MSAEAATTSTSPGTIISPGTSPASGSALSDKEREERDIPEEMIQKSESLCKTSHGHRFWERKQTEERSVEKPEENDGKRKWSEHEESGTDGESTAEEMEVKRQRIVREHFGEFIRNM